MIRFRASDDQGRPVIGLGLSRQNVERLVAGQPIRVTGESVGVPDVLSILVFFGETEMDMELQLRRAGHIGPDTITHYEDPTR